MQVRDPAHNLASSIKKGKGNVSEETSPMPEERGQVVACIIFSQF